MKDLEKEFTHMEQLVFTMRQIPTVKDFVSEENIPAFYAKATSIDELLISSNSDTSIVNSIVLYNKEGDFYRFLTPIGNTTASRIYSLIHQTEYPDHIIVETEMEKLIGYGCKLYKGKEEIGAVAVLINEATLISQLYTYDSGSIFHIAVAVNDNIIASNQENNTYLTVSDLEEHSSFYTKQKIGITPYYIIVATDKAYLAASNLYFTLAASATALLFAAALVLFTLTIRKQFFVPMMTVINNVENLDINVSPASIPVISNPDFANLIEKVNEMLERIDSKNKAIQKAELQKQNAIIISLKKQINAHFTVNTINIIRILISKKELEEAVDLCDGLSTLIRYAHDEDEFINVWDEFLILQNYINIMNVRYSNRFIADFDIDDRLMDYKIPRMLLQPIVENAMIHGYKNYKSNCKIDITAKILDNKIEIEIKDYGDSMDSSTLENLQKKFSKAEVQPTGIKHIALENINCRIKSYYGNDYGLSVSDLNKGTKITVTLGCTV